MTNSTNTNPTNEENDIYYILALFVVGIIYYAIHVYYERPLIMESNQRLMESNQRLRREQPDTTSTQPPSNPETGYTALNNIFRQYLRHIANVFTALETKTEEPDADSMKKPLV